MSAAIETTPASPMSATRKLAALLVILGAESAAALLQRLDQREVEAVAAEVAKLTVISQQLHEEILREFGIVVAENAGLLRGGADYAEALLLKSLGAPKAAQMLDRIAPEKKASPVARQFNQLPPGQIAGTLKNERPQTVALVLSNLDPKLASKILESFTPEFRERVIERVATLGPTPAGTVERVMEVMLRKAGPPQPQAVRQTGGIQSAATLLNGMDKRVSQSVLASLEERNPNLGQAIRQKMFIFDDLARLDTSALQKILREVDLRELAIALKTAGDSLRGVLLGCISKRAAETVKEEMSFMGSVKTREIEAAQLRIIAVLRRLEAEGEIDLDAGVSASEEE